MEAQKDPGITIEFIRLLRSHIEMTSLDGQQEYNLSLTALDRREPPDGKTCDLIATFNLMHGIEKPLFKFTCAFLARYTHRDDASMAWNDFTSAMALAHIIPYLREFVSNITNRLPAPVLMLSAVNTHAMIADYENRKRQTEQAEPAAQVLQKPA